MNVRAIACVMFLGAVACEGDGTRRVEPLATHEGALQASPADARPVPADYDGDGYTDMGLKGSNGIWYIDIGVNGFGGRWDYAYPNYGDSTAVPVPADYDGDGITDLAVKDSTGMWGIDYASNGFGVYDVQRWGYGDANAIPVPADYDNDRRADLAVKTSAGYWLIDYARNGFFGWDAQFAGYGNSSAIPVPADYDNDRRADLAVKDASGCWYIDYASNGFGGWNEIRCGYGGSTAVPVPADYDNDGRADIAVKDDSGTWYIDYALGGFGAWNASYSGRGGSWTIATPGDYDRDGRLDLSVKDTSGYWYIDYAAPAFGAWNVMIDNVNRVLVDTSAPWIDATEIYDESNKLTPTNGHYQLRLGVRYTVAVRIQPGNGQYTAGVEVNPDLYVPASLNVINRVGSTGHVRIQQYHTRRFALTCSQPGSFPLGFRMRDIGPPTGTGNAFNPDYGIRVQCTAARTGLYGVVSTRAEVNGRLVTGSTRIAGATVTTGALTTTAGADGSWSFPSLTGGPHRVTISAPGFSRTIAVNVTIPAGSGVQIDTPLEESFSALGARGMSYTTYIDYSRGRSILHTVRINTATASVKIEKSPLVSSTPPAYRRLKLIAQDKGLDALVLINGGYFNTTGNDASVGYFYSRGYVTSEINPDDTEYPAEPGPPAVIEPPLTQPLLTIVGSSTGQQLDIVQSEANFFSTTSSTWAMSSSSTPIWDVSPRDGVSDLTYGLQCAPFLLRNGAVIWRGVYDSGSYYQLAWARTAVAVAPGVVYLVVADGEGVNGGNGVTWNQLGEFFRDVLGATTAMNLDGGLSSEMTLRGASGPRRVNTLTGEDSAWDIDPTMQTIAESDGGPGSVFNYVMAGP